jgi:hypothetical protein
LGKQKAVFPKTAFLLIPPSPVFQRADPAGYSMTPSAIGLLT